VKKLQNFKLIIFDRDGVINQKPIKGKKYIENQSEIILDKNIIKIICKMQKMEIIIACATNQQGIGLGLISKNHLARMHNFINREILAYGGKPILFLHCPHLSEDYCFCRKPNPGMLIEAMEKFSIESSHTLFVGDQESDKLAAYNAGIEFIFAKDLKIDLIN